MAKSMQYVRSDVDGDLLSPPAAAAWLGVSVSTLYRYRDRDFPKPFHVGPRMIRYKRSDLEAYLAASQ